MAAPKIVLLWRALQPLQSVVSFMNTNSHPDDETSEMLAALAFRDGLALSYACANRGEGGQNDIGSEATHDLGVIRTAEMERAADQLDMRLYWLSETPEDSIFDFGFSKSGVETLAKFGGTIGCSSASFTSSGPNDRILSVRPFSIFPVSMGITGP